MRRSHLHRAVVALTMVALLVPLFALTAHAAIETVSGTVTFGGPVTLSPTAVAVITIADRSKDGAGTIIGQQRIDAAAGPEIPFSVPYDSAAVNKNNAYGVVASVVDGTTEYQNAIAVPTITGGPTEGLSVVVSPPQATSPTQVTGTITAPTGTSLDAEAVVYAIVLNGNTGRVIGRQVITDAGSTLNPAGGIPFTVTYDSDLVDPAASILAVGAIADAGTLWQTQSPTTVTAGTPVDLTVLEKGTLPGGATPPPSGQPTPTGSGSPKPTTSGGPTAAPTATPTQAPTAKPTATPTAKPTATPTQAPSASPSATPTQAPSATASASASGSASPGASASPSTSPSLAPITVSGTLIYREPHNLSADAFARVVVVQLSGENLVVIGSQEIDKPGPMPIPFTVQIDQTLYNPNLATNLWAEVIDGTNAWTTGAGVPVLSNGAPTENVAVQLAFRPDLIQGEITGVVTGIPTDLTTAAWAMVWALDGSGNVMIGFDAPPAAGGLAPIPFVVPFTVANIDPSSDYFVYAAVYDTGRSWENKAGVPVITKGNPFEGIQVPTVQTASASPSPSATASAAPTAAPTTAASATPAPTASGGTSGSGGGGIDPIVLGVLALVVIGGAAVVFYMRR